MLLTGRRFFAAAGPAEIPTAGCLPAGRVMPASIGCPQFPLPVPQYGSKQAAYPLSLSKKYSGFEKKLAIRESGPTRPSG